LKRLSWILLIFSRLYKGQNSLLHRRKSPVTQLLTLKKVPSSNTLVWSLYRSVHLFHQLHLFHRLASLSLPIIYFQNQLIIIPYRSNNSSFTRNNLVLKVDIWKLIFHSFHLLPCCTLSSSFFPTLTRICEIFSPCFSITLLSKIYCGKQLGPCTCNSSGTSVSTGCAPSALFNWDA